MGLIRYGVPEDYVLALRDRLGLDCFVETGTFEGGSAAWAAKHFGRVVTIESSAARYHKASLLLARHANVTQLLGDSAELLPQIAPSLPPSIIWLDAHWAPEEAAGQERQCPLFEELAALAPCWERVFVLVDDARLFLQPVPAGYDKAQWPELKQLIQALAVGKDRFVACFEDVLVSLPAAGREPTAQYLEAQAARDAAGSKARARATAVAATTPRLPRRPIRRALRPIWSRLKPPALRLARAVGHLPVDLKAQAWAVGSLRRIFDHPRGPLEFEFGSLRLPGSSNDVIDVAAYYFGAFEWPVASLLRDLARSLAVMGGQAPVLYDVGANTGHHSLFASAELRRVYAFEPYADVRQVFEGRLALNRLEHIVIFPFALGDLEGQANFYQPLTANRGTGSFLAGQLENSRRATPLPVVVGDRFIGEQGLEPPDLIKLDVEGGEKLVLGGLAETIRRHRPIILSELSAAGRWLFGGEEGLREKLYPDCLLLEVARGRIPRGYRLGRFDFTRSEQFLCLPAERASMLRRARWPWRGSRLRHG